MRFNLCSAGCSGVETVVDGELQGTELFSVHFN